MCAVLEGRSSRGAATVDLMSAASDGGVFRLPRVVVATPPFSWTQAGGARARLVVGRICCSGGSILQFMLRKPNLGSRKIKVKVVTPGR